MYHKAASGLKHIFALSIVKKIVESILNILVLRNIDPYIFGLTMHIDILCNLSSFYLKNCLKNCYQKRSINPDKKKSNE